MAHTMTACRVHAFGHPPRVEQVPVPVASDGLLLVEVRASGVNPVDWKIIEGFGQMLGLTPPFTLGCEMSGVVAAGADPASGFSAGEEVFAFIDLARCGTHAQFATARPDELCRKPAMLSHAQAAALPVAVATAWQALFEHGQLRSGQRVLIHAAAGGVGSVAVQLAKAYQAHVIATASAQNHEYVTALGADEVIDYRATPFEQRAAEMDLVFDTVGGDTQQRSFGVLKSGGRLVSIVSPPASDGGRPDVTASFMAVRPSGELLQQVAPLVSDGRLMPEVAAELSLAQVQEALDRSKAGHTRGKLILIP